MNVRAQAARALTPVLRGTASLSAASDIESNLDPDQRSLFKILCFGVCRRFFSLNTIAQKLVSKPLKDKDADIEALILIGLYQLRELRIPDHAAISETVNAARQLNKPWAANLINGILRNYQRREDKLNQQLTGSAEAQAEHPQWLLSQIKQCYPEGWREIVTANNAPGPLTLRVNQQQQTRTSLIERFATADITCEACCWSPVAVRVAAEVKVSELPGFNDGDFSVQDEAAQLSAELLDLLPGQRVLDACCAPGGKTCHILERQAGVQLTAIDLDASRMLRVEENLARLKLTADLKVADVSQLDSWWDGQLFDRILLDAPCSATGVIRRHPDIKLLRRDSDIIQLQDIQQQLLEVLWSSLAPGGLLIYATCSILPQENSLQIARFVETHADALHLPLECDWGIACEPAFGRQLLPKLNGHDGFYYARIRKSVD